MVITVDGPVGSGKSSICKRVARELGLVYLDTGAMYRATALLMQHLSLDIDAIPAVVEKTVFTFAKNGDRLSVFIDGKGMDVTELIRTPEISEITSSIIAKNAEIRKVLVAKQREVAQGANAQGVALIADGRDMGTKVFPDARCKIYLDASPEVRADRRLKDYQRLGVDTTFDEVLADLLARDDADTNRKESPLRVAAGAVVLDTSGLTADESVKAMADIITAASQN